MMLPDVIKIQPKFSQIKCYVNGEVHNCPLEQEFSARFDNYLVAVGHYSMSAYSKDGRTAYVPITGQEQLLNDFVNIVDAARTRGAPDTETMVAVIKEAGLPIITFIKTEYV